MRSRALWGCWVMWCLASVAGRASAQDRAVTTAKSEEDRIVQIEPATVEADETPAAIQYFPLDPGTIFERHVVLGEGADPADATAGATEQLIFSNTLGTFKAALGENRLVADDITTTVPGGCRLRRYEFPVVGKADPLGIGGAYTVKFALYSNCPGAVQVESVPSLIIPGTQDQAVFPDDAPRLISFVAGDNVPLPTNFWLGVSFSRNNAGVVAGTPPMAGFSCDQFDYPGFPCNANLGGFLLGNPQASFNLEIYSDADCPNSYTGYKNNRPSGSTYNPGAGITFADDIELSNSSCNAIAYEVAIKGVGFYTFDLRRNCDGSVIAGTETSFTIGTGTDVRIARFTFATPIPLPRNLWLSANVSSDRGGVVVAGQAACIGRTEDIFGLATPTGCTLIDVPGAGVHAAFSAAITCAGAAPVGACCDMFITGPNGEAVCRQVPETNCPFPPRFSSLQPTWVDGEACEPDPFGNHSCGQAACCYADEQGDECTNLTQAACNQAGDLTRPRQWQIGRYCNDGGQLCPRIACLGRTGECTLPRCQQASACSGGANNGQPCTSSAQCPGGSCRLCGSGTCHVSPACCDSCPPIGCQNADCCTRVCNFPPDGPYCCDVEWDEACSSLAADPSLHLCNIPPANDVCVPDPTRGIEGARLLVIPPNGFISAETDSGRATAEADDPGFGCYLPDTGPVPGAGPGSQGLQTVWYKFVATQTSALFQTCNSNAPADDSLLEVFAVGDPSDPLTQCHSLIPIGCSDDFPGCSSSNKNSKICIRNLVVGNLYYVLVAAKFAELPGKKYRLEIFSPNPCGGGTADPVVNNECPGAKTITDGTTHFGPNDLPKATLTAPIESCIPTETADVWYRYTATCTGTLTVETCGANAPESPDTNLAIYDGGLCPYNPVSGAPLACSTDAGGDCGQGSKIEIDVVQGARYTIRLADSLQNGPEGDLKVACVQANCPAGEMTITSPPNGVVDAGRPSDPNNAALLQGINTITATAPHAALASCFTLCDTAFPVPVPANSVVSAVEVEDPPGSGTYKYTITLARPITAGALTTLTYTDVHGLKSSGRFNSHPANVNADLFAQSFPPSDVEFLLDALNGAATLPWGSYSGDVDRSAGVTAADILEEIDLLNGAGVYIPWEGTSNPSSSPFCPPP